MLDLAVKENIIQKSGSWFSYNNEKMGQGRENAKQYLADNSEILNEIEKIILEKYNIKNVNSDNNTSEMSFSINENSKE